jgi:hypothetical protein
MAFLDALTWLTRGRYRASGVSVADGESAEMQVDASGNLKTCDQGKQPAGYHRTKTPGAGGLVKSAPGKILQAWGFNDGGSTVYVQFFDKASALNPGDVPLEILRVPAGSSFSLSPDAGIPFGTGLRWATSSTPGTYTATGGTVTITVAFQ